MNLDNYFNYCYVKINVILKFTKKNVEINNYYNTNFKCKMYFSYNIKKISLILNVFNNYKMFNFCSR